MEGLPARANTWIWRLISGLDQSDTSKFLHTDIILDTLTASFFLPLRPKNISKGGLGCQGYFVLPA